MFEPALKFCGMAKTEGRREEERLGEGKERAAAKRGSSGSHDKERWQHRGEEMQCCCRRGMEED